MSVQVSAKKQVIFGIMLLIVILGVIEAIANVWWILQIKCEFEQNEIFKKMDEQKKRQLCMDLYEIRTSGREIIPNQSTDSIKINKFGFRGPEFSEIKPINTYRIFMLGGSTMFGTGATSDQTTIPGYLQQFLNNKDLEYNIEVINAGIQASDSNTELKLIEEKIIKFSPDLIIIYDGWNDLRTGNNQKNLQKNWKTICELGQKNDFDVIIALQPIAGFGNKILTKQELVYSQIGEDYNKNPLIDSLAIYNEYAQRLSEITSCTKTVDLRDVFDTEVQPIFWDQGHVSDTGNSIIAKSFYKRILAIISKNKNFSNAENDSVLVQPEIETLSSSGIKNILMDIISNYKTPVMLSHLI